MSSLAKKLLIAVLGVVVTLAWWSWRGSSDKTETADRIPAKVWEGGGGTLSVEVESTCKGKMSISFTERGGEDAKARRLEVWEEVAAGRHTWTIDIPPNAGGYIEFGAIQPKVGDRLTWTLRLNGNSIDEQDDTLKEELKSNYAFFLQSFYDDYSKAKVESDDN